MKSFKYVFFCGLLALTTVLSGCNTMDGLGKDIQSGGKSLSHAASSD